MTEEQKPWYASRTIWGSLIAVAAALLSAIGMPIDQQSQALLVDAALQAVTIGGSLLAIFGRLSASTTIK